MAFTELGCFLKLRGCHAGGEGGEIEKVYRD
jgi:hypothetical protein